MWLKTMSLYITVDSAQGALLLRKKELFTLWECLTFYHFMKGVAGRELNETFV